MDGSVISAFGAERLILLSIFFDEEKRTDLGDIFFPWKCRGIHFAVGHHQHSAGDCPLFQETFLFCHCGKGPGVC